MHSSLSIFPYSLLLLFMLPFYLFYYSPSFSIRKTFKISYYQKKNRKKENILRSHSPQFNREKRAHDFDFARKMESTLMAII